MQFIGLQQSWYLKEKKQFHWIRQKADDHEILKEVQISWIVHRIRPNTSILEVNESPKILIRTQRESQENNSRFSRGLNNFKAIQKRFDFAKHRNQRDSECFDQAEWCGEHRHFPGIWQGNIQAGGAVGRAVLANLHKEWAAQHDWYAADKSSDTHLLTTRPNTVIHFE